MRSLDPQLRLGPCHSRAFHLAGVIWIGLTLALLAAPQFDSLQAAVALAIALPALAPSLLKIPRHPRENRPLPELPAAAINFTPFISVHVATHDEPPKIVIRTLEAMTRLDYPRDRFEVVVLDNNTPDAAVWKPVREWCDAARDCRFRFHHFDGVTGAKAGALNLALSLCDSRATFIAVVDADYAVAPGFLRDAANRLARPDLTFIQYPQSYRGVGRAQRPVEAELASYFEAFATAANPSRHMLLTGTLSVIRREALLAVGGWPTDTITEDADLGARLLKAGGRGRFIPLEQGAGLLPPDLPSLSDQRLRWAAGNAQVLRKWIAASHSLPPLPVLRQLLAWTHGGLILLPALAVAAFLPEAGFATEILAAAMILLIALEVAGASSQACRRSGKLRPAMVRLALLAEGGLGLLSGLAGRRLRFIRTPKLAGVHRPCGASAFAIVAAVIAAVAALLHGLPFTAVAAVLIAASAGARLWLAAALREPALVAPDSPALPQPLEMPPARKPSLP